MLDATIHLHLRPPNPPHTHPNYHLTYYNIAYILHELSNIALEFTVDDVPGFSLRIEWEGPPFPPPYLHYYPAVVGKWDMGVMPDAVPWVEGFGGGVGGAGGGNGNVSESIA